MLPGISETRQSLAISKYTQLIAKLENSQKNSLKICTVCPMKLFSQFLTMMESNSVATILGFLILFFSLLYKKKKKNKNHKIEKQIKKIRKCMHKIFFILTGVLLNPFQPFPIFGSLLWKLIFSIRLFQYSSTAFLRTSGQVNLPRKYCPWTHTSNWKVSFFKKRCKIS